MDQTNDETNDQTNDQSNVQNIGNNQTRSEYVLVSSRVMIIDNQIVRVEDITFPPMDLGQHYMDLGLYSSDH